MFDVTSTTNCKVKFIVSSQTGNSTTLGNTGNTTTGMTFVRLGDT